MVCVESQQDHVRQVVRGLDGLLRELVACKPKRRSAFKPMVPRVPAIYLLSEGDSYVYVGRTRSLNSRLAGHMRPSSRSSSASLAFLIAKEDAENRGISIDGSNAALEKREEFGKVFREAKKRVAKMDVRYVPIASPVEQALLEVYVSESLGT